jgi:hypothetical protein
LRLGVVVLAAAVAAGVVSRSSYGITWCFDWVAYEVNGHQDTNRGSAGTLIKLLEKRGYKAILLVRASTSSAAPGPQDIQVAITQLPPPAPRLGTTLKPGDVIIFGSAHAGIIRSSNGRFDHFLQDPASEGTAFAPERVVQQPNYYVGPDRSWTLQQIFAASRDKPPAYSHEFDPHTWLEWLGRRVSGAPQQYPFLHTTAQVWRQVCAQWDLGGSTWGPLHQIGQIYTPTLKFSDHPDPMVVSGEMSLPAGQWQAAGWKHPTNPFSGTLQGDQLNILVIAPHIDSFVSRGRYQGTIQASGSFAVGQTSKAEVSDGDLRDAAAPTRPPGNWTGSGEAICRR